MSNPIPALLAFLKKNDGINDKAKLAKLVVTQFNLTTDRSVYYCAEFAIRFSASQKVSFSNTVASLSRLQKFDDRPFISCLVTPGVNLVLLANSTLLKKVSHSSQQLRVNNIKGSFNGSDILREFAVIPNSAAIPNNAANLLRLFNIHAEIGFEGNLPRLVEATNNISPTGNPFKVTSAHKKIILAAPMRAQAFTQSKDCATLKAELDAKVKKFQNEILIAAMIENVNVRGRVIEYLIAGEDERLHQEMVSALNSKSNNLPAFKTENALGDYSRNFKEYLTETDVKTKIMILDSNPKAYNLDKILEFLSQERSVFLFYFVGIELGKPIQTVLVSMFQKRLLDATILLKHWAGRNSRGVSQFEGKTISQLIQHPEAAVNVEEAGVFLDRLINLKGA
ncbi:MAG: hypothetical protein HOO97_09365 [Sideroxydans sp.]|nr:hypothetical protein [Sideroxydans sp.]